MKIIEYKKKNGTTVYRANIYLGVDSITGKKVKTSVTGRTKKEVKIRIKEAQHNFKANGQTVTKEHENNRVQKEKRYNRVPC